jgi:hypothetical protein
MKTKVNIEEQVNIILTREELYTLIRALNPPLEECYLLNSNNFGNFKGQELRWEWDLSQLDYLPLVKVVNFYLVAKDGCKEETD